MPHIVCYPNEILKARSQDLIKEENHAEMVEHMREVWSAIESAALGLAAVQTGITKRLCIMKVNNEPTILINPTIVEARGVYTEREYCFSVPGISNMVEAATEIDIEYFNEEFELVQGTMTGKEARVLQHEIRHMDGLTILDVGSLPKQHFEAKLKALARKYKGLLYV